MLKYAQLMVVAVMSKTERDESFPLSFLFQINKKECKGE